MRGRFKSSLEDADRPLLVPTGGGWRVLPGALHLQEDGVGVVGKQKTSDQTEDLRRNTSRR